MFIILTLRILVDCTSYPVCRCCGFTLWEPLTANSRLAGRSGITQDESGRVLGTCTEINRSAHAILAIRRVYSGGDAAGDVSRGE